MLSAASSWVISSIFVLYFLICSLMSISTHLCRKLVSSCPVAGEGSPTKPAGPEPKPGLCEPRRITLPF